MNRWHFAISFDPEGGLGKDDAWYSNAFLRIEVSNCHPLPRHRRKDGLDFFLFGNPIADGKRDDGAVVKMLCGGGSRVSRVAELNGSFLVVIFDPASSELTVANDRFAALALYHCRRGNVWHAASSLKVLRERGLAHGAIDETAMAEFLVLRRLFGEKTLQKDARYMASASIIQAAPGGVVTKKYWSPDYSRQPVADRELPGRIADALKACVVAHLSDEPNTALLLSGGLDSRALLAAAPHALDCFTAGVRENNEVAVAREVAAAAGANFHFVSRQVNLLEGRLDDAAFLTGGQQIYSEAQFLGFEDLWPKKIDTFLIGLGPDIFFGGLYLPKQPPRYFGRPALHYRLKPLAADLATQFLSGVSYRLKQSDPNLVIKKTSQDMVRDRLLVSIREIMERARTLGAEGYAVWEHMHIDNLSRHYSFPMMTSLRCQADCRAPALDNDVFDISFRMTAAQKVNGTAYQNAITLLAPHLMAIRNANTNLPARLPLPQQTLTKMVHYAARLLPRSSYPVSPGAGDRSWPGARESLEACPSIMVRLRALAKSEPLATVPFLDMDGVARAVDDFCCGRKEHGVLLNVLLTLDSYLRPDA